MSKSDLEIANLVKDVKVPVNEEEAMAYVHLAAAFFGWGMAAIGEGDSLDAVAIGSLKGLSSLKVSGEMDVDVFPPVEPYNGAQEFIDSKKKDLN